VDIREADKAALLPRRGLLDTLRSRVPSASGEIAPMYELASGPLVWISLVLFVVGLVYRTMALFRLTERKVPLTCTATPPKDQPVGEVSAAEREFESIARFRNSVAGKHPIMTIVSGVFHVCLMVTPLLVMAHNLLLRRAVGVGLPSVPDGLSDFLTVVVLGCGLFFLVRRVAVPKVAAISGVSDYAVLAITVLPFLTGFLAYHQLFEYRTVITLHLLSGELMLIAMPFTKIGHMVFFFFSRLTLAGEYCLGRGTRIWST
jgi:nitrate reductase gamma subunit